MTALSMWYYLTLPYLTLPYLTLQKFEDHVIYFHLEFSSTTFVPEVIVSIVIDTNLHVKLFYKGSPIPLPEWFRQ